MSDKPCPRCGGTGRVQEEPCEHEWRASVVTLDWTQQRCRKCRVTRMLKWDDEELTLQR